MQNFIYGFHSINSLINTDATRIECIYLDNKRQDKRQQQILQSVSTYNISLEYVNTVLLTNYCKTDSHQGIAARIRPKTLATLADVLIKIKDKSVSTLLILDGITDPHNLGAIIRTAECFGIDGLILPKNNSANIDNPIIAKVSSGALNYLDIVMVNNISQTLEILKEHEFWVAGTSCGETATNLFEFTPASKMAWVMGNEATGIRHLVSEHCDYLVTIPTIGNTQSLNVAVASGVILSYSQAKKHHKI